MFHEGDLQSGIARALQESKSVICFVTDDSQEAEEWQEWLRDGTLGHAVTERTVALKLQAGSQEAGFLSVFCPISRVPTLVVVYQGQLAAQLESGITKDDFSQRLTDVISRNTTTSPAATVQASSTSHTQVPQVSNDAYTSEPSTATTSVSSEQSSLNQDESASTRISAEPLPMTSHTPATSSSPPANIQSLLEERRQRLEADHAARQAEEKAAKAARAKARQKEAQAMSASSQSSITRDRSYEAEQAKRKREAKEDRERILKQIENDKIARKEREERRRAAARGEQESGSAEQAQSSTPRTSASSTAASSATSCALQIRLLDGSTIRTNFEPAATLASQVRQWVSTERPELGIPYTLKVMQAPQPPRLLGDSDENSSLRELGLLPSATLIMAPARGTMSSAYPGAAGGASLLGRLYSLLVGFVMWAFQILQALVARTGTAAQGTSSPDAAGSAAEAPSSKINPLATDGSADSRTTSATSSTGGTSKIRIRTLRDRNEDKESREFYNGNQLSFEPRKDNEDADDKGGVS